MKDNEFIYIDTRSGVWGAAADIKIVRVTSKTRAALDAGELADDEIVALAHGG